MKLLAYPSSTGKFFTVFRTVFIFGIRFHNRPIFNAGDAGKGVVSTVFVGIVRVEFIGHLVPIVNLFLSASSGDIDIQQALPQILLLGYRIFWPGITNLTIYFFYLVMYKLIVLTVYHFN